MTSGRLLVLALLVSLGLAAPTWADESASVYRTLLPTVVWVYVPDGAGRVSTGTGTLVDKEKRLVLTNFHVVGEKQQVRVAFPRFLNGKLVAERDYYLKRIGNGGIRGEVVDVDRKHDLALIKLREVADDAKALAISSKDVEPGQAVHSIGNPGKSGALWVYTQGKVRQTYNKRWQAKIGKRLVSFESKVIETDSATNPGDSGGPLANDAGQLVGVTQGGAVDAQLLSLFIDVSEVRRFLARNGVRPSDMPMVDKPAMMKREKALTIRDEAKLFGPEAVAMANKVIAGLHAKSKADLLIETFATPPGDWAKKIDMTKDGEARAKLFQELAQSRAKAEKINGVYLFLCKNPGHMRLIYDGEAGLVFSGKDVAMIGGKMLERFRKNEFDEGLTEAVKALAAKMMPEK